MWSNYRFLGLLSLVLVSSTLEPVLAQLVEQTVELPPGQLSIQTEPFPSAEPHEAIEIPIIESNETFEVPAPEGASGVGNVLHSEINPKNPSSLFVHLSRDGKAWQLFLIEADQAHTFDYNRYRQIRVHTEGNNAPPEYDLSCQTRYLVYWNQPLHRWDVATIAGE